MKPPPAVEKNRSVASPGHFGAALSLFLSLFLSLVLGSCGDSGNSEQVSGRADEPPTSVAASVRGQTTSQSAPSDQSSGSRSGEGSQSSIAPTIDSLAAELTITTTSPAIDESVTATSAPPNDSGPESTTPDSGATTAGTKSKPSSSVSESTVTSAPAAEPVSAARSVKEQAYIPMAFFADVQIVHPSARVERVGFHESNHDGARQLEVLPTAIAPLTLETRERGTGSRTAADVVVDPQSEIRAPVTGTVLRAGGYILYCEHNDDFVVIEPDSHPGWELKVLHINGIQVSKGEKVEAGVTVLAPAPTQLPFDSQVDEFTAEPSWPHVHLELVDPSIPDRPSQGGGC